MKGYNAYLGKATQNNQCQDIQTDYWTLKKKRNVFWIPRKTERIEKSDIKQNTN